MWYTVMGLNTSQLRTVIVNYIKAEENMELCGQEEGYWAQLHETVLPRT